MIKLMPLVEEIYLNHLDKDEINELDLKRAVKNLAVGTALGATTMFGSPKASAQTVNSINNKTSIEKIVQSQPNEQEIKKFILIGNTQYWKNNEFFYSFNKNGKFFSEEIIYGEGGMKEGKWEIQGNKLILTLDPIYQSKPITYIVQIKKGKTPKEDQLILNGKVFKRD